MSEGIKIQVFGSGCPSCKKLHEMAAGAAKELGIAGEVEYVDDVSRLLELGVMQSPALSVGGRVVLSGFVPAAEEVREIIRTAVRECGCGGCSCVEGEGCGC